MPRVVRDRVSVVSIQNPAGRSHRSIDSSGSEKIRDGENADPITPEEALVNESSNRRSRFGNCSRWKNEETIRKGTVVLFTHGGRRNHQGVEAWGDFCSAVTELLGWLAELVG